MMEFPEVLAAARKVKGAEWKLADALLAEVGPRGSAQRFVQCAEYLHDNGIDYSTTYLRQLHAVAREFPPDSRLPRLTPNGAWEAGSPAIVERAVADKRERARAEGIAYTPPTKRELRTTRRVITEQTRRDRGGPELRTAAERKHHRDTVARKSNPSELARTAKVLKLMTTAGEASRQADLLLRGLADVTLTKDEREDLIVRIDKAIEMLRNAKSATKNSVADGAAKFLRSVS